MPLLTATWKTPRVAVLAITAGGAALGCSALGATQPALVWNYTESVSVGLYRIDRVAPHRGDILALTLAQSDADALKQAGVLRSSHVLIKPLAGIAGDRVCRDGLAITLNGALVAEARSRTSAGGALPVWTGCYTLGTNELFLIADHPSSFDSRYLGPVTAHRILGVAHPLITLPASGETR